jgi:hypothetical protein
MKPLLETPWLNYCHATYVGDAYVADNPFGFSDEIWVCGTTSRREFPELKEAKYPVKFQLFPDDYSEGRVVYLKKRDTGIEYSFSSKNPRGELLWKLDTFLAGRLDCLRDRKVHTYKVILKIRKRAISKNKA